jgi:hypothetical protein
VIFYITVRQCRPVGFFALLQFSKSFARCCLLLAVALLTGSGTAGAAELRGLYEATAPLDQTKTRARDMAFADAMEQVLVRVTGRRDVAADPGVSELLAEPGAYAVQFRETVEGELWVGFDRTAVNEVLSAAGLPIWGGERPSVLMLVAMDLGGGDRYVLAAEDDVPDPRRVELREEIDEQSNRRGLPVVLPLMDVQDRSVLSFTDVWGGFDQVLVEAAERYDVDTVLLGRYRYDEPDRMRWTLLEGEQAEPERWIGRFEDGIGGAADRLAVRYAVATDAALEGEIGLAVTGVADYADFRRVVRFLEGLTAIEHVSVRGLDGEEVIFGLALRGSLDNVDQAIRLGGLLEADPAGLPGAPGAAGEGERRVALAYRLGP